MSAPPFEVRYLMSVPLIPEKGRSSEKIGSGGAHLEIKLNKCPERSIE